MAFQRGENINLGVGVETVRGTAVTPGGWVPARTPSGVNVTVKKTLIKETKSSGINSQASQIVHTAAEGSLEWNLRNETLPYFVKSLLGKVTSTVVLSSYKKHAGTVETTTPQFPSLTFGLSQAGTFQDYKYNNALVTKLDIKTSQDDLVVANADFIAASEATTTAYSVAFAATDHFFRPQDVTFKLASAVSGLGAAPAVGIRDFAISIKNNARPLQNLGSLAPNDNIAGMIEVTGEFTLDYQDSTYHDLFIAGTAKALQLTMERTDIELGTSNYPKIEIILDKVTFEGLTEDRPIDDLVTSKISFTAHYDATNSNCITINCYNTVASY